MCHARMGQEESLEPFRYVRGDRADRADPVQGRNRRSRPGGGAVRGRPGPAAEAAAPRALTAAGLVLAAAGLVALDLAGLGAPSGRMLMLLCAPVAAGLAVALTASLRAAGPPGALAGLILLLAGLVAGYLAAGAVQLRVLTGATTLPAAHAALATAAGHWTLTAAALAGAVALALACIGRRRTGARPSPGRSRDPE